jgi:hypothetical protein
MCGEALCLLLEVVCGLAMGFGLAVGGGFYLDWAIGGGISRDLECG